MTLIRAKFIAVWLVLSIVGTTLAPLGAGTARAVSTVNPEDTFNQIRDDAIQRCDPQSPQSGRGLGNALGKAGNSFANQMQQGLSKSLSSSLEKLFSEKLPEMLGRKMEQLIRRQQNKWLGELGDLIDRRVDSLVTRGYEDDEIRGVLPDLIEDTAREFFTNLAQNEIPNALRVELRLEAPRLIGEFYAPTGSDDPADIAAISSSEIRRIIEEEFSDEIDAMVVQAAAQEIIKLIQKIFDETDIDFGSWFIGSIPPIEIIQVIMSIVEKREELEGAMEALRKAQDGTMREDIIDAMAYYATEGLLNSNGLINLGNRSAQIFLSNGLPRFTEYLMSEDSSGQAARELGDSSFDFVSNFHIGNRFADTISLVPGTVFNTLVSPTGSTFVESFRLGFAGGPSSEQLRNVNLNGYTGSLNTPEALSHAGRLSPTGFQALQDAGYDSYVTEDVIDMANANTGEPLLIDESFGATVDTNAPHMSDFQPPANVDGLAADATSGIKANAGGIADHAAYSLNGLGESFKGTLSGSIANGLGNLVSGVPFAGPILATLVEDLTTQLITPLLDAIIPTAGAGAAGAPLTAAAQGAGTAAGGASEAHAPSGALLVAGPSAFGGIATAVAGVAETIVAVVSSLEINFGFTRALLGGIQGQTKVSNANEETIIKTEQENLSVTTQICIYEHTIEKVRVMVAQNELFYDRQASQRAALGIRNNFLNVQKYLQAGYAVSEGALGAEGSGGGVGGEQNSGQPLVANLPEDLELARRETTGVLLYELLEQSESPFREEIGEKLIASTQGTFAERMRPTISEEDRQKITTPGRGGEIEPERYRAVWNKLIEPQNNAPGAEYLVGEEHARRQAETEQNTRETLLANNGFRDSRICEVMVGTPGGPYCAKWKVLTPGSTLKAYWDRLLAAVLEQATNVQKAGQDFITNFFSEVERALVDSANSGRATGAPAPGLPASDPCPGPGPCPGTGWEAAAQNQDTGGLFDTAAIGRTLEDLLERGFNTLSDF